MSTIRFDIINYMSGLTGYVFDRAVLERIALERGVDEVEDISELSQKQKDLIYADELLVAYQSPDVSASSQQSHGNFKSSVGSQSINPNTRKALYNQINSIYSKYNDPKLSMIKESNGKMQFVDILTNGN